MSNEQSLSSETAAFLIRVLEQSSRPLSQAKFDKAISKSSPIAKKDLPKLLQHLVNAGEIRSGRGRSTVYWLPPLEEQASQRIIEALDVYPLTPTELKAKFKSLLNGWPQAKRLELIERLIKDKRVYKVAPLTGKAKLLSIRQQPTPQDYVTLALNLTIKKLAARGIPSQQVLAAAREVLQTASRSSGQSSGSPSETSPPPSAPVNLEQLILDRISQLNPAAANGALVSLTELRRALQSEIPSKSDFDQAVLQLAEQGRVALHRHDYVSSLSQAERDALVSDERGNHFVGVALRV